MHNVCSGSRFTSRKPHHEEKQNGPGLPETLRQLGPSSYPHVSRFTHPAHPTEFCAFPSKRSKRQATSRQEQSRVRSTVRRPNQRYPAVSRREVFRERIGICYTRPSNTRTGTRAANPSCAAI